MITVEHTDKSFVYWGYIGENPNPVIGERYDLHFNDYESDQMFPLVGWCSHVAGDIVYYTVFDPSSDSALRGENMWLTH